MEIIREKKNLKNEVRKRQKEKFLFFTAELILIENNTATRKIFESEKIGFSFLIYILFNI